MTIDLTSLVPQIQAAQLLIGLGVATVQQVIEYFRTEGHDEETLAAIRAEVEVRISRRQAMQVEIDARRASQAQADAAAQE